MAMPWDKQMTPESLKSALQLISEELHEVKADPGYNPRRALEIEYYRSDGTTIFSDNIFSIIRDKNGNPMSIMCETRDITERKLIENTLRASEEKNRNIKENMSDIVSELDAQGFFKYTSPSHRRIFGDSEENLIGTSAFARVHPDDRDLVMSQFQEGVRTKRDKEVEYRFRHADGNYIWVRSLGHSFFDATGEFAGSIITTSDITERKKAEFQKEAALKALSESEEFLRETQAIAKIRGYKTNPETDFLQWTEGVFRMVEAPMDYQPGLTEGLKYYVPEYIPLIRDLVMNTLSNNEPFVKEVEVITS